MGMTPYFRGWYFIGWLVTIGGHNFLADFSFRGIYLDNDFPFSWSGKRVILIIALNLVFDKGRVLPVVSILFNL